MGNTHGMFSGNNLPWELPHEKAGQLLFVQEKTHCPDLSGFNRPHQSLGYLAPIEHIEKELAKICCSVLPMWSASTTTRQTSWAMVYY